MDTLTARLAALFALGLALPVAAQPGAPTPRDFRIVRSDPLLDEVVSSDARLELIGHTDSDGPDTLNLPLSEARATTMLSMVGTDLFEVLQFAAVGAGRGQPATPGQSEADKERNRRVSFHVQLPAAMSARERHP